MKAPGSWMASSLTKRTFISLNLDGSTLFGFEPNHSVEMAEGPT